MRRNSERILETTKPRIFSSKGHKIDAIYTDNNYEVGCTEAGLIQKDDGMLKLPKLLKDMMSVMVSARPDLIRSLKTVGFIIMGKFFK